MRSFRAPSPPVVFPKRLTDDTGRILSRTDCETLFNRIVGWTTGGETVVTLRSTWTANFRWSRNRPSTAGDTTERTAFITRVKGGRGISAEVSQLDDASLQHAVQTLEQRLGAGGNGNAEAVDLLPAQQYLEPTLWSDATYHMTARERSLAASASVEPASAAKLVAAGYLEVGAATWAVLNTRGLTAYAAATGVLYAETVRHADGKGSGWAGKTHMDWAKLDVSTLSTTAVRKCLDSANPVALEPGRYTAILEPDVVSRMLSYAVEAMERQSAEGGKTVYSLEKGKSKIGLPVFDRRITIRSDPMDPECGYMPFDPDGNPYRPVTWVENGVLKELAYDRAYARQKFGTDTVLPNPQSFRVSGGDTSIEEMIATTQRGILVTNTNGFAIDDDETLSLVAVTQNGLWLIENGKITHPIKNFWVNESPMTAFNKVRQIGRPVRAYGANRSRWNGTLRDLPARALNNGRVPIVAPPIKVDDFNFTRLTDAI